jgi:hypothetical protein
MLGLLVPLSFVLAGLGDATKVELKPETLQAFDAYLRIAETRIGTQESGPGFLWVDGSAERLRQVRQGKVAAGPKVGNGQTSVPDGLIHDWIGATFIPGATVDQIIRLVQDYNNHKVIYKPEVIDSKLLSREGNDFRIYLRLVKKQVLTVVLNTNHEVRYTRVSATRWYSHSQTTRITEVEDAGTPHEQELPPGKDHGFLWKLNSYWRFEERDGGVYVECEAISLTRDVPTGLGWFINPIIQKLPKDSLVNALSRTGDRRNIPQSK